MGACTLRYQFFQMSESVVKYRSEIPIFGGAGQAFLFRDHKGNAEPRLVVSARRDGGGVGARGFEPRTT